MKPKRGTIGKRGREKRKRAPIILFAAEGKNKTETKYLCSFNCREGPRIVSADGNETDPVKMMDQLIKEAKKNDLSAEEGDRAFCIIDGDADPQKQAQIDRACAKQNGWIKVILSNPCIEEWFLCHFRYSTKCQTNREAIDELDDALKKRDSGYKKSMNIYDIIKDDTETAITNAQALETYHDDLGRGKHSIERNPSSEMYQIIEYILKCRTH